MFFLPAQQGVWCIWIQAAGPWAAGKAWFYGTCLLLRPDLQRWGPPGVGAPFGRWWQPRGTQQTTTPPTHTRVSSLLEFPTPSRSTAQSKSRPVAKSGAGCAPLPDRCGREQHLLNKNLTRQSCAHGGFPRVRVKRRAGGICASVTGRIGPWQGQLALGSADAGAPLCRFGSSVTELGETEVPTRGPLTGG